MEGEQQELFETEEIEAPPEAPPEASPGLSPDIVQAMVKTAVSEALAMNNQTIHVEPTEEDPFGDPKEFWKPSTSEDGKRQEEFHSKVKQVIAHETRKLKEELNQARGIISMMDRLKADNPNTAKHHDHAVQLMRDGKINDYETALKFAEFSTGIPSRASGNKPKPMPARSAVSPSTQRGQSKAAAKEPYYATVYELIQNDPEIQAALNGGG